MMNSELILQTENLSMTHISAKGDTPALEKINFTLSKNEFVCVIGPSGCGKSTLLRILAGTLQQTSGNLHFFGNADPKRAVVFQDSNLLPWLTLLQNIALPLRIAGIEKREAERTAQQWVQKIALDGFEQEWPSNLSGGMAQRVALARALIQKPDVLLLDEPFGALDALTREIMAAGLVASLHELTSTVMVTHSISEAALLADRILILSPRPAQVIEEIKVPFPRPHLPELRYRSDFIEFTKLVRSYINL